MLAVGPILRGGRGCGKEDGGEEGRRKGTARSPDA